MTGDEIAFRPAAPDDVEAVVPLMYSSGPAALDFVFAHNRPGRAQDFMRYAFTRGTGELGWRNYVVAVADGRVVAVGAGWDGDQSLAFTFAIARQIFGFYGPLRAWGVMIRGLQVERVMRPADGGEFYIGYLGVDPAARSRGIGAKLVAHLLTLAPRPRCVKAVLDVAAHNPRAQALYERLGFVVTTTRVSRLANRYGKISDHRRMELRLGPTPS